MSFLGSNPDVADRLVPDEEKAIARAAMQEEALDHFTLATRVRDLAKAVGDIRRLTYQIRRLRRAQGDLPKGSMRYCRTPPGAVERVPAAGARPPNRSQDRWKCGPGVGQRGDPRRGFL